MGAKGRSDTHSGSQLFHCLQMLRGIVFSIDLSPAEEEPDLSDRHVMFRIHDGLHWSEPAFATVTILPVNDNQPVIQLTARGQVRQRIPCL